MVDEQFKSQVNAYVDEVWEDVVADITRLVRINSVEDVAHAEPGKPWGPAPYEALSEGLAMAGRLGLDAHDCEGYIGYADLKGERETQIATIAHTDIVPTGIGWTVPALDVTRRDGYLLGRGVLDDKGPFVLSLYAAHFFARLVEQTGKQLPGAQGLDHDGNIRELFVQCFLEVGNTFVLRRGVDHDGFLLPGGFLILFLGRGGVVPAAPAGGQQ
jgi:succinyl-diaminopimelate desuccinylase